MKDSNFPGVNKTAGDLYLLVLFASHSTVMGKQCLAFEQCVDVCVEGNFIGLYCLTDTVSFDSGSLVCRFSFNQYIVDVPRWIGSYSPIFYIRERKRPKPSSCPIVCVTNTHVAECLLTLSVIEKWCVVVRVEQADACLSHISRNKITVQSVCWLERGFFLQR